MSGAIALLWTISLNVVRFIDVSAFFADLFKNVTHISISTNGKIYRAVPDILSPSDCCLYADDVGITPQDWLVQICHSPQLVTDWARNLVLWNCSANANDGPLTYYADSVSNLPFQNNFFGFFWTTPWVSTHPVDPALFAVPRLCQNAAPCPQNDTLSLAVVGGKPSKTPMSFERAMLSMLTQKRKN
jgi:hypothetical protein